MHKCSECSTVLSVESGAHQPGIDPCPKCGSLRVDAHALAQTATATVTVPSPTIKSLLSWSTVWLEIAHESHLAAVIARSNYADDPSRALTAEFHHGLGAVSAAASAILAEQIFRTGSDRSTPNGKPTVTGRPINSGDWLGLDLLQKSLVDAATAAALGDLFQLRHASIHPRAVLETLVEHPVGTHTSPEVVAYNADVVRDHLAVADTIVAALRTLPEPT